MCNEQCKIPYSNPKLDRAVRNLEIWGKYHRCHPGKEFFWWLLHTRHGWIVMDLYVELTWACLKMVYIHVYPLVGMMTMGFGGINMFRPGGWQAHKKDPFSTRDGWICYTVSRVPVSKIDFLDYRFGRAPLSKSSGVLPCASHAGEKSWKAWCWIESSWAGSVVIMELSSSYRRWSSMGPAMPSLLIGGFKDFLQHWICLYIFGMIVPTG